MTCFIPILFSTHSYEFSCHGWCFSAVVCCSLSPRHVTSWASRRSRLPTVTTQRTVIGEILVEAQDGGLMLQADDGRIWTLQPKQIAERKSDDTDLVPIDADEMEERLLKEMPSDFKVFRTQHYIVVYNSNEAYAKQVASLFESLYRGFFSFWKNQRWELAEPRFPLVAVVLRDDKAFLNHAGAEIGELAKSVIGYYHLTSNQMTTYNVANLERNVSTIIHEATHQLAYNTDMQRRFADNPMWVSEGLATFFESPDRRNPKKWRHIGRVNEVNLRRWFNYFAKSAARFLGNAAGGRHAIQELGVRERRLR